VDEKYKCEKLKDEQIMSSITGVSTDQKPWSVAHIKMVLSDDLVAQFKKNCKIWVMNSEASKRTAIDMVLRDVVAREEFNGLKIFCEVYFEVVSVVGNKRRKLTGRNDYNVGHAGLIASLSPPKHTHLIAVEAKKNWDDEDVKQCINEAGAIHKARKEEGKGNSKVWGIITNGGLWRFLKIDNDGQVFVTDPYVLNLTTYDEEQLLRVYCLVYHVVKCSFEASPTTTPASSLATTPTE
jgi:hypothetical protein